MTHLWAADKMVVGWPVTLLAAIGSVPRPTNSLCLVPEPVFLRKANLHPK